MRFHSLFLDIRSMITCMFCNHKRVIYIYNKKENNGYFLKIFKIDNNQYCNYYFFNKKGLIRLIIDETYKNFPFKVYILCGPLISNETIRDWGV